MVILILYARDTHRIANQTVETSLKPVILRSGYLDYSLFTSIDDVQSSEKPTFIEFTNLQNIAKDISGHIIIDGKSFPLLFQNEITQRKDKDNLVIGVLPKWGWLPTGGKLYATYKKSDFSTTTDSNQIYLKYKDIEGNLYHTKEDSNYSQTSGRD